MPTLQCRDAYYNVLYELGVFTAWVKNLTTTSLGSVATRFYARNPTTNADYLVGTDYHSMLGGKELRFQYSEYRANIPLATFRVKARANFLASVATNISTQIFSV